MATAKMTGPTRWVAAADGTVMLVRSSGGGSGSGSRGGGGIASVSTAEEVGGSERGERLLPRATPASASASVPRGVVWQVAAALHSVNMFARPVIVTDAGTVAAGRAKTRIFAVLFVAAVLLLVILNAVQTGTFREEVDAPSWAAYEAIAQHNPTCTCSNPGGTLGDVVNFYVPPYANFSANLCRGLQAVYNYCSHNTSTTAAGVLLQGCSSTDAAALLWNVYLESLAISCYYYILNFETTFTNVARVPTGPTLLSNASFQQFATSNALSQLRLFVLTVNSLFEPLGTMAVVGLPSAFDLVAGAKVTSPPNCTCAMQPSASARVTSPCTFQPAFDPRPASLSLAAFSCNAALGALFFPLEVLALPQLYSDILGLPPPYAQYTAGYNLLPPNITTFDFFLADTLKAFFGSSADGNLDTSYLAPGFMTADFTALFDTCAPVSCNYVYSSRPALLQIVTALLGTLSGMQTVLTLAVDRGYDTFLPCCRRWGFGGAAPPPAASAAHDPDDDDDDGDDASGGGVEGGTSRATKS